MEKTTDLFKNKNYFKTIDSEDKAYFLGFLLADGNISKTSNRLCFTINSDDDYILETFKEKINSSNIVRRYVVHDKRTNKNYNSSVFQVSSKELKEDLSNLGFTPYKSEYFDFSSIKDNKYFNHFLRGLFDGDGYVAKKGSVTMLISTKEFLEYLSATYFSNSFLLINVAKTKNVWRAYINSKETSLSFLDFIYKDATIFLKRKYEKYKEMKRIGCTKTCTSTTVEITNNITQEKLFFESIKDCAGFFKVASCTLITCLKKSNNYKGYTVLKKEKMKKITKRKGINYFIKHVNDIL